MNKEFINGHYKIIHKNYPTPPQTTNFHLITFTLLNISLKPYDPIVFIQKVISHLKSPLKARLATHPTTSATLNPSLQSCQNLLFLSAQA